MKKILLLLAMLFIGGCSVKMEPNQLSEISHSCDKNDGIAYMWLVSLGYSDIQCKDGATFKYLVTRP